MSLWFLQVARPPFSIFCTGSKRPTFLRVLGQELEVQSPDERPAAVPLGVHPQACAHSGWGWRWRLAGRAPRGGGGGTPPALLDRAWAGGRRGCMGWLGEGPEKAWASCSEAGLAAPLLHLLTRKTVTNAVCFGRQEETSCQPRKESHSKGVTEPSSRHLQPLLDHDASEGLSTCQAICEGRA